MYDVKMYKSDFNAEIPSAAQMGLRHAIVTTLECHQPTPTPTNGDATPTTPKVMGLTWPDWSLGPFGHAKQHPSFEYCFLHIMEDQTLFEQFCCSPRNGSHTQLPRWTVSFDVHIKPKNMSLKIVRLWSVCEMTVKLIYIEAYEYIFFNNVFTVRHGRKMNVF